MKYQLKLPTGRALYRRTMPPDTERITRDVRFRSDIPEYKYMYDGSGKPSLHKRLRGFAMWAAGARAEDADAAQEHHLRNNSMLSAQRYIC